MFHLRNIADLLLYVMISRISLYELWAACKWESCERCTAIYFLESGQNFRHFSAMRTFVSETSEVTFTGFLEKAIQKRYAHRKLHKYLPIHFETFLKTPLLEKTSRQLLLKPLHTEIFYFMFFRIAQEHSHEKLHFLLKSKLYKILDYWVEFLGIIPKIIYCTDLCLS